MVFLMVVCLTVIKGSVGPWRRYALYRVPFQFLNFITTAFHLVEFHFHIVMFDDIYWIIFLMHAFECVRYSRFTVHYPRWRMTPFMRQCWGLRHRLAQCVSLQGWGKSVYAALLSLMRRVWVYAAVPSSQVNSSDPLCAGMIRVTREAGRGV